MKDISVFKDMSVFIDKIMHPNREKREELMSRINELRDLSEVALEYEVTTVHQTLNREMNEKYMQFLVYAFLDGVMFLIPHFFAIWFLSLKFNTIYLPFSLPGIGNHLGIGIWYPICAIAYYIIRAKMRKRTKIENNN